MTTKAFDGDRNDWVRIEEYADGVISGILEAVNFKANKNESCHACDDVINMFRDHIIWTINPDYFT
jgi:hypothetical protein